MARINAIEVLEISEEWIESEAVEMLAQLAAHLYQSLLVLPPDCRALQLRETRTLQGAIRRYLSEISGLTTDEVHQRIEADARKSIAQWRERMAAERERMN